MTAGKAFFAGWVSSILAAIGAIELAILIDRWLYERRKEADRKARAEAHPQLPGLGL